MDRELALHMADFSLVLDIPSGPHAQLVVISQCRSSLLNIAGGGKKNPKKKMNTFS